MQWNTELVNLTQDDGGVTATVKLGRNPPRIAEVDSIRYLEKSSRIAEIVLYFIQNLDACQFLTERSLNNCTCFCDSHDFAHPIMPMFNNFMYGVRQILFMAFALLSRCAVCELAFGTQ